MSQNRAPLFFSQASSNIRPGAEKSCIGDDTNQNFAVVLSLETLERLIVEYQKSFIELMRTSAPQLLISEKSSKRFLFLNFALECLSLRPGQCVRPNNGV